jgi:predicted HicB family RNase H-like nuclease
MVNSGERVTDVHCTEAKLTVRPRRRPLHLCAGLHRGGKFNLRTPPELHEELAMTAEAHGLSLNTLAQ